MRKTKNLGMNVPERGDQALISDIGNALDIVDEQIATTKQDLQASEARIENKLSNCDLILDTSFSASGIINIPTSKTYSFYTIILKGDDYSGITFTIPKYVMDNYNTPFYFNVVSLFASGYTAKADGQIHNNKINVASVSLTGWTQVSVYVFGVY